MAALRVVRRGKGLLDRLGQTVGHLSFLYEGERSHLHCSSSCIGIISGTQDNDLNLWNGFLDTPADLEPIHLRQEDIDHHDVRLQESRGLEQRSAIRDEPDDVTYGWRDCGWNALAESA